MKVGDYNTGFLFSNSDLALRYQVLVFSKMFRIAARSQNQDQQQ